MGDTMETVDTTHQLLPRPACLTCRATMALPRFPTHPESFCGERQITSASQTEDE
jgi:hypothetical protein